MKRNDSEYDCSGGISQSDADDLARTAQQFEPVVEKWICTQFPAFAR